MCGHQVRKNVRYQASLQKLRRRLTPGKRKGAGVSQDRYGRAQEAEGRGCQEGHASKAQGNFIREITEAQRGQEHYPHCQPAAC